MSARAAASRILVLAGGLLAQGCVGGDFAGAAQLPDAESALLAGRYDDAIAAYRRLAERAGADPAIARGHARALAEVGRYDDAIAAVRRALAAGADSAELANTLGELLVLRGDGDGAARAFEAAIAEAAPDRLTAEYNLAALRYARGEHAEALAAFDRFIDVYNESRSLDGAAMTAVASAVRYLGAGDPQLFRDAMRAYEEAIRADPADFEPRIRLGELFLEKYNSQDARALFNEVLSRNPSHPRALLGMARAADFDGSPEALDLVQRALEVNPNLVPARVLLANVRLALEEYDDAEAEAARALEVDPSSLEALSVQAAARYLRGDRDGYEAARRRVLELNPRHAELYGTLADAAVRNRLYREAVEFARQGVALDSLSWRARGLLGINQLRIGEIEAGRRSLEAAFAGDPYNVWIKNTLDLLDTFAGYRETDTARFRLVLEQGEAELLGPYMAALAEEAYDRLAERYGYRPAAPIRVEVFPRHADFSVRTVGLTGLGALGVSFGPVVAMDSPSARERGEFNWGSTLWHELAHTFHLGLTDHRVPRWLTEGLAVFEERRARPGWGSNATLGFLAALAQDRLLPVAELNNGFVRPDSPERVSISYYQASLVCELIEREHGFQALLDLLAAYREGLGTEAAFRRVLGTGLEEFDRRFDAYLQERFAGPLAALRRLPRPGDAAPAASSAEDLERRAARDRDDFVAQLATGRQLFRDGRLDDALPYLERARDLIPDFAAPDGPRWFLAQIHKQKGQARRAADELTALTAVTESHYDANIELAGLLDELGDADGAAAALDRAIYIHPFDLALHTKLAELFAGLDRWAGAVRERRAVVALDPVDRAEALYQLAFAEYRAGHAAAARRTVLRALEIAPNFERAQELLLRLRSGAADGSRDGGRSRGDAP